MKQGGREGLKPIKPESYREAVSYILPKQQPEVSSCWLNISHLLQKCKKGKHSKKDLPLFKKDITTISRL